MWDLISDSLKTYFDLKTGSGFQVACRFIAFTGLPNFGFAP